jgi:hypothetical protein
MLKFKLLNFNFKLLNFTFKLFKFKLKLLNFCKMSFKLLNFNLVIEQILVLILRPSGCHSVFLWRILYLHIDLLSSVILVYLFLFAWWCLTPLSRIFQMYIVFTTTYMHSVPITTNGVSSNLDQGEVIKFVRDLWQVVGFLRVLWFLSQ